ARLELRCHSVRTGTRRARAWRVGHLGDGRRRRTGRRGTHARCGVRGGGRERDRLRKPRHGSLGRRVRNRRRGDARREPPDGRVRVLARPRARSTRRVELLRAGRRTAVRAALRGRATRARRAAPRAGRQRTADRARVATAAARRGEGRLPVRRPRGPAERAQRHRARLPRVGDALLLGATVRGLARAALLAVSLLVTYVGARAAEIAGAPRIAVVVGRKSFVTDVTVDDLRELYLRRRRVWPNGRRAIPVNLPADN